MTKEVMVDDEPVTLQIWDTAGQGAWAMRLYLTFLLCFSDPIFPLVYSAPSRCRCFLFGLPQSGFSL